MKKTTLLLMAMLMGLPLGEVANADLILGFKESTVEAGGTGAIDVVISSSNGADSIGKFQLSFAITQTSGTGVLSFKPSFSLGDPNNPLNQSNSERISLDPAYVFGGNVVPLGFGSVSTGDRQTILQIDRAQSNMTLGITPVLLARLELQHTTPASDQNASYRISLQNSAQTQFQLLDNNSATLSPTFFGSTGTVSITAVPEPTSALLVAISAATLMLRRRIIHQRRKSATTKE
jgi:hypothetical protein